MEYRRMNRPTLVTRGSLRSLKRRAVGRVQVKELRAHCLGVHGHGAELPTVEFLTAEPNPALSEKDGPAVGQFDRRHDAKPNRDAERINTSETTTSKIRFPHRTAASACR